MTMTIASEGKMTARFPFAVFLALALWAVVVAATRAESPWTIHSCGDAKHPCTICHTRPWRPGDVCSTHATPMVGQTFIDRCESRPTGYSIRINRDHQPAVYQCWDSTETHLLFSGGVDERIPPQPSTECEQVQTRCSQ